jgi:copper chaperone NosL
MKMMKISMQLLCLCGVFFLFAAGPVMSDSAAGAAAGGKGPVPAQQGVTAGGELQLSKTDRCPVCGMFPAKRPKHAAAMVLKDGRTYYFCGNGCLLRTWHRTRTHLGVSHDAVAHMVVRDYFSGSPIDAYTAWWVAGSDVVGPMGRAVVALRTPKEVEVFKNRHGGEHVFTLSQLNDRLFTSIFSVQ